MKTLSVLMASAILVAPPVGGEDPAVQSGVFVYELHELRPFYEGCVQRAAAPPPAGAPSTVDPVDP